LAGSINIDAALSHECPTAPRWDYGIGHRRGDGEEAVWVEVHRASAAHVGDIIRKKKWLEDWLSENALPLQALTRRTDGYVWLSTGGVDLQRSSRQARLLAQSGVSFPREHLVL
jgi:hypothetical protein